MFDKILEFVRTGRFSRTPGGGSASGKKKVGLALGSGGIKGLAHVGVLRILLEQGIEVDYLAGASIGSWIGAHWSLYRDIDRLEEFTVGKKTEKLAALFEPSLKGGLIKGKKLEKLLEEWLEDKEFGDLSIPLKIVATELVGGAPVIFETGKLAPAVRASIAVPSLFTPMEYEGLSLVDGGVCNPVPVDIVRQMGADIVIAVNLDNYRLEGIFDPEHVDSLSKVTGRSIDLLRHYLSQALIVGADILIQPANAGDELSKWKNYFTEDIGARHVELGREAAREIIPDLKKLLTAP